MKYVFNGFSTDVEKSNADIETCFVEKYGKYFHISTAKLYKKSIDARKKRVGFISSLIFETENELSIKSDFDVRPFIDSYSTNNLPIGYKSMAERPLIVGMGPSGLFCAYLLALKGYRPILIERGASVEERRQDIERLKRFGILNVESNVHFGAGGAGTFSDGKLLTRIKDERCAYVLNLFKKFGADTDILTDAKPHIGTDVLPCIVDAMIDQIKAYGGKTVFHCRYLCHKTMPDGTISVETTNGSFKTSALVLAIGNAARDTFENLLKMNLAVEPKPISIGVRIEHLQSRIDESLYGDYAGHPNLGPATYSLSDTSEKHGVYTFCMCPGGEVVPTSTEEELLAVNGMSNSRRDGKNANSAVLVSVGLDDIPDYGLHPCMNAVMFQREIEQRAYDCGGGDYAAPVMTVGHLLKGKENKLKDIEPSYCDGRVTLTEFDKIYPRFILDGLKQGITSFAKKIRGFDEDGAVLTAAETRTSSPIRLLRDRESMQTLYQAHVYPIGEGAGYAGGITSAAVDGLRCAEAIIKEFKPY